MLENPDGPRRPLPRVGAGEDDEMKYRQGDRVRHPNMKEWGIGEVLQDSAGGKTHVFFVGAGEKALSNSHVALLRLTGVEAENTLLDNLHLPSSPKLKYRSLTDSIEEFLQSYPGGFHGDRFRTQERDYKEAAHRLGLETLGESQLAELCEAEAYDEVCKRARKLVGATNLMFPNEKMAFNDSLQGTESRQTFAETLKDVLHGTDKLEDRFKRYAGMLQDIGAGKWTTATYFQFLLMPDRYMFIKPTVTQKAAAISAFEIGYTPQINWTTYRLVLEFAAYLKAELSDLKPRDMIDVQSFMWCIKPVV